jgi:hypothetical protein
MARRPLQGRVATVASQKAPAPDCHGLVQYWTKSDFLLAEPVFLPSHLLCPNRY